MNEQKQHVQWWLVLPTWNRLHFPAPNKVEWWRGDEGRFGEGYTVCGRKGSLQMPGFLSRMGLPRCAHCCDSLGIERGAGDPINTLTPIREK